MIRPAAAVFALGLAAALLAPGGLAAPAAPAAGSASAPADASVHELRARPLSEVGIALRREAPAGVVARNESRLAAELTAPVVEVAAFVGQKVREGAVLARLDDADFRLALARLQAQRDAQRARLELSRKQLQRAVELQRQNFISSEAVNQRETEVVSLQADLRVLDAQVAAARRQIDKTVIRAPFDGVVRERLAQVGSLATPGTPLFDLVQSGAAEVSARVPSDEAERLAQVEDLTLESGGRSWPLRLLRVSPLIDRASRSREARLGFVDDATAAPPGTAGRLLWRDPRPAVPPNVVVRRSGELGVFVVEDGRARFVPLPQAQEGRAAVVALPPRTLVVDEGQGAVQDGDPVRLRGPSGAASPGG